VSRYGEITTFKTTGPVLPDAIFAAIHGKWSSAWANKARFGWDAQASAHIITPFPTSPIVRGKHRFCVNFISKGQAAAS
jgi:hypothetical protein